jgi:rhamnosyltransferase
VGLTDEQPRDTGAFARPRVLVLLAAFNGARWIAEQLQSILAQDQVECRVVVRDDGSKDATWAELAHLAHDERIQPVLAATPSGSAAQNFLALIRDNAATGFEFIAFSDQDDVWNPDKLRRACAALTKSAAAGYSSATSAVWPHGRRSLLTQRNIPGTSDYLFEGAGQGCTFVLTADFYGRVRRFFIANAQLTSNLHFHDWAVYALARTWKLRWHFDPEPSMMYRQHGGNDTGARHSRAGVTRRIRLISAGWYSTQLRVIANICAAADAANTTVIAWRRACTRPPGWPRRWAIVLFCLRGGRRRMTDNAILILSALAGWI